MCKQLQNFSVLQRTPWNAWQVTMGSGTTLARNIIDKCTRRHVLLHTRGHSRKTHSRLPLLTPPLAGAPAVAGVSAATPHSQKAPLQRTACYTQRSPATYIRPTALSHHARAHMPPCTPTRTGQRAGWPAVLALTAIGHQHAPLRAPARSRQFARWHAAPHTTSRKRHTPASVHLIQLALLFSCAVKISSRKRASVAYTGHWYASFCSALSAVTALTRMTGIG